MKSISLLSSFFLSLWMLTSSDPEVTSAYFDSEGKKLHYITAGTGTPVVLIHGFSDNISVCYRKALGSTEANFVAQLAERYQVIALDVKGHGKSDKPHEVRFYGKALEEDMIRLMDHLEIDKAHIVGYSMGAFITGNLMLDHPERVLSATLIGGTPLTKAQNYPEHPLNRLLEDTADALNRGEGMTPLIAWFWPGEQPKPTQEELAPISQQILVGQNTYALQACMRSISDLWQLDEEKLSRSIIPVTLINGTDDPLKNYIAPFQELAHSQTVWIEGANHMDILTYPSCLQAVSKALVEMEAPLMKDIPH